MVCASASEHYEPSSRLQVRVPAARKSNRSRSIGGFCCEAVPLAASVRRRGLSRRSTYPRRLEDVLNLSC
jgi:hypothetical protein